MSNLKPFRQIQNNLDWSKSFLPVIQVNHVSLQKHPSNFFGTIQISGTIGHCPPKIGKNEHSLNGAAEIGVSELLPVFLSGRTNPGNVP